MNQARTEKDRAANRVQLGLRVDRELRRELKSRAALEEQSMEDKLHNILCLALDRPDLMPEHAAAS